MLRDALKANEDQERDDQRRREGTIDDPIEVATPDKEVQTIEPVEFSITDLFPDLGPLSPALPPQPLPIVKTIIAEQEVDVEMDEVEPNWAAEVARRDQLWEVRLREIDDQWARHLATLNREGEDC